MKCLQILVSISLIFASCLSFCQNTSTLEKKFFKGQLLTPYDIYVQKDTLFTYSSINNNCISHYFLMYEKNISIDSAFNYGIFITSDSTKQFLETTQIRAELPSELKEHYYTNIPSMYIQKKICVQSNLNFYTIPLVYFWKKEINLIKDYVIKSRYNFDSIRFLIRNFEMFYIPVGYVTFKTINYNAKSKDDAFITRRVMCYFITDIVNMD